MTTRRPVAAIAVFETSLEEPFYPEATAFLGDLRGEEGNAYAIMGAVSAALKKIGVDPTEYAAAAMSGDYDNLLFVSRTWVTTLETGPGVASDQE